VNGPKFEANLEDKQFQVDFWKVSRELLAEGKVVPHEPDVRAGGLDKILEGLGDLKNGRVSGKKIVYKIGE
jgi:hypothetical protein